LLRLPAQSSRSVALSCRCVVSMGKNLDACPGKEAYTPGVGPYTFKLDWHAARVASFTGHLPTYVPSWVSPLASAVACRGKEALTVTRSGMRCKECTINHCGPPHDHNGKGKRRTQDCALEFHLHSVRKLQCVLGPTEHVNAGDLESK
jgi:hypothetical protein